MSQLTREKVVFIFINYGRSPGFLPEHQNSFEMEDANM